MPRREPAAYVWDVLNACQKIERGMAGLDRERYLADEMNRYAFERLLMIVGEAITQLDKHDSDMAAELGDVTRIVGFRNVLVHDYWKLDHGKVWDVLAVQLPPLRDAAEKVWSRFSHLYEEEPPAP